MRTLVYLAPVLLLLAACSDDDPVGSPDTADDANDAAGETGQPDLTDETGAEVGDLADEPDVIIPTCFEEDGERPVGTVCAPDNNRICLDDSHCRDTEACELDPESEEPGTCIYQLPDPIDCPGGPDCADVAEAPLRAAFAARTITPLGWELPRESALDDTDFVGDIEDPETFFDCGRDMICPGDDDYESPDADGSEGDGRMQGIWMAGLNQSVPALLCPPELLGESCSGVDCCAHERAHDDIWARGVVFEQGNSKIAIVALDLIGFFYSDVQDVVAELPAALGIDVLVVASTHAHEGPDTMGLWGPGFGGSDLPVESGINRAHIAHIRGQVISLLEEADAALADVDVYATSVHTGVDEVAGNDTRDPWIFNDNMALLHVVRAGGDRSDPDDTVGTLVNWGNHPESIGGDNQYISSDYPHYVRTYLEEGLPEVTNGEETVPAVAGLGGTAVFLSGTLGGLTTPLRTSAVARDGTVVSDNGFAKADAMGQQLAQQALEALATAPAIDGDLSFGARELMLGVPNLRFHIAIFSLELFPDREIYNWRYTDGFEPDDPPQLLTAMARMQIGSVSLVTVPGELFPETAVGGFRDADSGAGPVRGNPSEARCMADLLPPEDGDNTEDAVNPCLVDPDNPNPPDIDAAPEGGWLHDELPGEVLFIVGNGMDSIGYLVPDYDYELSEAAPYLSEAPGDHYEETNGVGPALVQVLDELEALWDVTGLFE